MTMRIDEDVTKVNVGIGLPQILYLVHSLVFASQAKDFLVFFKSKFGQFFYVHFIVSKRPRN